MDTSGEEKTTTSQEKNMGMVVPGEENKGQPRREWFENTREDMKNIN